MKKVTIFVIFLFVFCFAQEGARYLIITHDNFYNAIQPLAEWKNLKGIKTKVVRLSETGSTNTQIRNYIINAYNTWNPRPEFVLLVGSADYLPSFFRNVYPFTYDTDNEYANMTGDYQAELCYGRFPVKTQGQCSTMVAKTLSYERYPSLNDTNWYKSGTLVVNEDGSSDTLVYWGDVRFVATHMLSAGYTKIDSFSRYLGHSATDVVNAVTDGISFVLYRGHGVGNWFSPFAVNPALTNNGNKLPIICSFTCATMTIAVGESMVGDAWVKAGSIGSFKGAVAFVGNTHSGINVAPPRSAMTHGFFNSVFPDSSPNLGTSVLAGKHQIYTQFNDQTEYEGFNLLGDPELCMWTTVPKPLEVSYLSTIPMGSQDFIVTVTKQGFPLPNALVCIMKDNEVYAYNYTNTSGQVFFAINPTSTGMMSVTVTARNCLPHEGSTQIIPSSGPYPIYFSHIINDPYPGGNSDGDLNPGEVIKFQVGIKNVGTVVSRNVWATLRTSESEVIITDSIQYYGDIQPDEVIYSTPGFGLSIAPACTNHQYLDFTLYIHDSVGNYTQNLSMVVDAGKLSYQSYCVTDPSPGGNNNERFDPGESGKLMLTLQNIGSGMFYDVQVKLRSTDQYLTISDSTGHFGQLNPGESKTNTIDPFAISVSQQAPFGYRALVRIVELGLGGTYEFIDSINLILIIGEDSQSAPTGPDGYGYYCYDNLDVNSGQAPIYNWIEINTIGQIITQISNANDAITSLTLPFTFRFYGQDYTTITVSSNGYLVMGSSTFNSGQNTPILNGCPSLIAPFWDDLNMSQQQGYGDAYRYNDATNHRYIIEYRQAAHYSAMWFWETFEVILLDPAYYPTPTGDGEIIFQYQTVSDASSNTVGICDPMQTQGIQIVYNSEYEPNAASLTTGRAYRLTTIPPQTTPVPWLGLVSMNFSDSLGNNNGLVEPGEHIIINLSIRNLGQVSADNVNSILRSQDSDAIMLDSTADFGNIEPGATVSNSTPYRVQIIADPSDSIADFALFLNANSGGYTTVLYFSLNLSGVIAIEEPEDYLRQSAICYTQFECFPNPFTNTTVIRFTFDSNRNTSKLNIYDVRGRLIKILTLPSQVSEIIWNGADHAGKQVAKGLYFITLTDNKNRVINNRKVVRTK